MKTRNAIFLMMILGMLATGQAFALPSNDNWAAATPVVLNGGSGSVITNNIGSTEEAGEPNHAENRGGKSVWFSFTPAATKVFRISTLDNTFDTLLAVYTGSAVDNLQVVGHNNDTSVNPAYGGASTVDLMLTAGTTYYIAVDGVNNEGVVEEGNFRLAVLELDAPIQDNFVAAYPLGHSYKGSVAGTNYGATLEANEPGAYTANPNGKSIWYKWTSSDNFSVAFEMTENFDSQIAVYTSNSGQPTFAQLTKLEYNIDYSGFTNARYRTTFFAEMNRTYYIKIDWHTAQNNPVPVGNFQLKYFPNPFSYSASFGGYGQKASISVFRPSEGKWYSLIYLPSLNPSTVRWGLNGDTPFAADFNGNGTSEFAAVRNQNGQKVWYVAGGMNATFLWGLPTDKVLVGDFDLDGRADPTAIRNTGGNLVWYVRQSRDLSMRTFVFGIPGDKPVLGDFDGDNKTEVAVVRNTPDGMVWHLLMSRGNYNSYVAFQFGLASDVTTVEDFDGDGRSDVAVFRPSNGAWYIMQSSNGQVRIDHFGLSGDKPQPADYNGDGKADLAVFRPSEGMWYIAKPTGVPGQNFHAINWGLSTDIPVSSLTTLSQ